MIPTPHLSLHQIYAVNHKVMKNTSPKTWNGFGLEEEVQRETAEKHLGVGSGCPASGVNIPGQGGGGQDYRKWQKTQKAWVKD